MTFGEQNTEKEAHDMLNYAIERGINTLDTAEAVSFVGPFIMCFIHTFKAEYILFSLILIMSSVTHIYVLCF